MASPQYLGQPLCIEFCGRCWESVDKCKCPPPSALRRIIWRIDDMRWAIRAWVGGKLTDSQTL